LSNILSWIDLFDKQLAILEKIQRIGGHASFARKTKTNLLPPDDRDGIGGTIQDGFLSVGDARSDHPEASLANSGKGNSG
jgi:hypothetical protein